MSTDEQATAPAGLLDEQFLRDFASRWHAAWNAYDPQQVMALCTDDVEWQQPSSPPLPRGYDGAAESVKQLQRACPDYRFAETEPPYASFDRRKAIVPWRFTGTMTGPLDPPGFAPTGTRIQIEGDDHWEFRGDLVYRCRVLYDANDVAMQLGAVPAPGCDAAAPAGAAHAPTRRPLAAKGAEQHLGTPHDVRRWPAGASR
jgi:SnoaL-like domain